MRAAVWMTLVAALASGCAGPSPTGPAAPASPPAVSQVQPSVAAVGDTVTVGGGGFTAGANTVKIGAGYLYNVSSADTTSLRFALPGYLGVCPPDAQVCVQIALALTPGTYRLSVINANGASNEVVLQVVAR